MTWYLPLPDFRYTVRNRATAFRFPASSRSLKKVLILRFSRCILPGYSSCFLSLSHHHPRGRRHLPPRIAASLFSVASMPAGSLRPDMLFHPVHLPRVRSPQVCGCAAPVVRYFAALFVARANPAHSHEYHCNDNSCFLSSPLPLSTICLSVRFLSRFARTAQSLFCLFSEIHS